MPFAHSAEDEAERWLRALRLHGQVGSMLQALGVGEAPLMTGSEHDHSEGHGTPTLGPDVLERRHRARRASSPSRARRETVGTPDILFAVLDVYGKLFDRALYLRGTSREELVERLDRQRCRPAVAERRPALLRRLLELAPEVEEVVGARRRR